MAKCVNYNFNVFMPEKDINDAVLRENPVPANVQRLKKLDDYFVEVLWKKNKYSTVAIDNVLEKLHKCNSMAMSALARLCVDLEEGRQSKTKSVSISVIDLIYLTEQAVLLIGQTYNAVSYHRPLSIHPRLMYPRQAKHTFNHDVDVDLFGNEICQHFLEKVRAKKSSKEVLKYARQTQLHENEALSK